MGESTFFQLRINVPSGYVEKFLDYFYNHYLLPQNLRFTSFSRQKTNEVDSLIYNIINTQGKQLLQVEVKNQKPIEAKVTPLDASVTKTMIDEAKQDIVIALQMFEENARKATMYCTWREGEKIIPEAFKKPEKSLNRFFLETQILFFAIFIIFGTLIFIVLATIYPASFWVAPLILIGIQFVFVFYANKFIGRSADWEITESNPTIHLLEFYLPIAENIAEFKKTYSREQLISIKQEIYNAVIAGHGEIDSQKAHELFTKHGVPCQLENLTIKKVNVYELVKKISDKFHFPTPKIVVANTMVPNAAASGPSPNRGLVLITTGLLVQLDENEILSVLGHEFGHLRGRDPLILYGLTAAEFLFRFYVLLPLFPLLFASFLFFAYFWGVMIVIFFIAKFFEARADLISATVIGQPKVLAGSLEKIGFQRLLNERTPSFRVQEWLGLDPHPPIYFRVDRLENLTTTEVKYPLIQSIRDVIAGFLASL